MSDTQRPRTSVRRVPGRGQYDRADIDPILDAGLVAHVGIVEGDQPFVMPMVYARDGDRIILHGSRASRLMKALAAGTPACVTITLLDGLVFARSAFHHSMNYRSVVVLGRGVAIEDPAERARAFEALVEHVALGRWGETRHPNEAEDQQTLLIAMPLDECSAKVRAGGAVDEEEDYTLPYWAGVLPFSHATLAPEPDERLAPGTPVPPSIAGWRASR